MAVWKSHFQMPHGTKGGANDGIDSCCSFACLPLAGACGAGWDVIVPEEQPVTLVRHKEAPQFVCSQPAEPGL